MEYKNRVLTIDALIENSHSEVLMIKRGVDPYKGYWALPGGYVDWDESIEDAVIREVKEETGLETISVALAGIYDDPARHPEQRVSIAYAASVTGEAAAGDDAVELKYFNPRELPDKVAFDHAVIISDYLTKFKGND